MSQDEYQTPTELLGSGEVVEDIVTESQDYAPYELLDPGDEYVSKSREVFIAKKHSNKMDQDFLSIELRVSELEDADGNKIELDRPLRTWINTLQFSRRNRPGKSSNAAEYLTQAGYNPKDLHGDLLVEALGESANVPMKVVIGWTNRTKKLDDNTYTEEFAKTRDFNQGTEDEPRYVPSFDKEGETILARHRIIRFKRV
jgi:hypothetical protein